MDFEKMNIDLHTGHCINLDVCPRCIEVLGLDKVRDLLKNNVQSKQFLFILQRELTHMNTSNSVLYNRDWWNPEDMKEFLKDLEVKLNDAVEKEGEQ